MKITTEITEVKLTASDAYLLFRLLSLTTHTERVNMGITVSESNALLNLYEQYTANGGKA